MADTWIGLDLGRMVDHSALAVIRRSLLITPDNLPARDHRGQTLYQFEVPQLKQYPKGTPYPEIVSHLRDVVLPQPWLGPNPRLVIDAGGVGGGIVDMLLDARLPSTLIALTITGGAAVTRRRWPRSQTMHWHVAKSELVSVVHSIFQSDRITIYPMPSDKVSLRDHAATLKAELRAFTVKQTKAANEVYSAREGEHDDILLATALPIFLGQRREYLYCVEPSPAEPPMSPELAALARESELRRQVEKEALARANAQTQADEEQAWRRIDNPHWWDHA